MQKVLAFIKKILPKRVLKKLLPWYHLLMAFAGAFWYNYPAKKMCVIMVTGTKGKSSTTELISAILEASGAVVASTSTIRFKIGKTSMDNAYKMTTPGRFFLQHFLSEALAKGCSYAVIEMSSEAAVQYRHKFLYPDAVVFLNLSPEHIESHGGYEPYVQAKLNIARELDHSPKVRKALIVNGEDVESKRFLSLPAAYQAHTRTGKFVMNDAEPYRLMDNGLVFTWRGEKIVNNLMGAHNIMNCLAAAKTAEALDIPIEYIKAGLESIRRIPGRGDKVLLGQPFDVVIDYAHTTDSLEKLYQTFPHSKKIGVLGNTGGGRDTWKRPEMAKKAAEYCHHIFLTNEDPYDEDPRAIIKSMAQAIPTAPVTIEMDRRLAIRKAIELAFRMAKHEHVSVLISGKGTDPYIMGAQGTKIPWSDYQVASEEVQRMIHINAGTP